LSKRERDESEHKENHKHPVQMGSHTPTQPFTHMWTHAHKAQRYSLKWHLNSLLNVVHSKVQPI